MYILVFLISGCSMVERLNPFHPRAEDPDSELYDTSTDSPDGPAPGAGFPYAEHKVFELSLDLPPASVDALERNGEYVPGTFYLDGLKAEVGVRLKGASTFDDLDGKPSLKVSFSAFKEDGSFLGVERLTMNSMKYDPTKLREAAAYRLFDQMDVPGSRTGYAHLVINGADYGLYSLIETLDENFLDRAFPGDGNGNLYDSTFVYADLTGLGVVNFDLQEGDPATAYDDLRALVGDLDSGNFLDVFERRFDVEETLTYLAIDLATSNWDGYSRNTNNYLLYHATVADRWSFVPWGQDTAFRGGGPLYAGIKGRLASACINDTTCGPMLEQRVRDVLDMWETEDLHGWTAGVAEVIGPACAADPRKDDECDHEDILEYLLDRPDAVRTEIGP